MARKVTPYLVTAVAGGLLTSTLIHASNAPRTEQPLATAAQIPSRDCKELFDLFMADQNDRLPKVGETTVAWSSVEKRDLARRTALQRLYASDKLKTGTDYYRGAVIMQHGKTPEDFLLAHEMALGALALGRHGMKWIVATTHDRLLISIGRRQRFGTQYLAGEATVMSPVEEGVSDALRQALDIPTLREAQANEAAMLRLIQKGQA